MSTNRLENLAFELSEYCISLSDFEIGRQIGHGGFSEVYIGMQTSTGKLCAIKILNAKDLQGDTFIVYEREIRILAKGRNLFLLQFVGFTTSHPFTIVTEYAPKGTLYDALHHKEGSPILTGTQKTIIAMGIAYGMHRLHKIRVIHRDLKSLNVLLDDTCLPKICDFGLSRYIDNPDTLLTGDIGTPHWMAPEIFSSRDYTNKVDVYSYGILLWELLTGTYPFKGLNSVQIAYAVCKEQARPEIPKHYNSYPTPKELKDLITICWHQDPAERPLFHNIYKKFANHEVSFPETDSTVVSNIVDLIRKDKIASQSRSKSRLIDTPSSSLKRYQLSDQYKSNAPIPILSQYSNNDFSEIRDPNSPNFSTELIKLKNSLQPYQAESFFKTIKPLVRDENPKILILLLNVIAELINKAPDFFQSFIQMEMLQVIQFLSFDKKEVVFPIYQILVTVFTRSPTLISKNLISQLPAMCNIEPIYALHLINIYTCMHAPLPTFWDVADILVKYQDYFLKEDCIQKYLKLLFTLIQLFETYRQSRQQYIGKICMKIIINQSGKPLHLAYQLLSFLLSNKDFQITKVEKAFIDALIRHINIPDDAHYALSFLIRLPYCLPYVGLIKPICLYAPKSKEASAILIEYSENEEMALEVLNSLNVLQPLPTLEYTIRILLTVLRFQSCSEIIASQKELHNFFIKSLMTKNIDIINAIATIEACLLTRVPSYANNYYESTFLVQFFDYISKFDNQDSWSLTSKLVSLLAKKGYNPQLLNILGYIENELSSSIGEQFALSILNELCDFEEVRKHILNSKQFPNCSKHLNDEYSIVLSQKEKFI